MMKFATSALLVASAQATASEGKNALWPAYQTALTPGTGADAQGYSTIVIGNYQCLRCITCHTWFPQLIASTKAATGSTL